MDDYKFTSKEEFIDCFRRGCEAEFKYNEKHYSITRYKNKISIAEALTENKEMLFNSPEEALRYPLDNKYLGDVLLDLEVLDRTLF